MKKLLATGLGIGALAIGVYTGVSFYTAKVAEAKINELIAEVDDDVVIEYGQVSVNPLGADITVKDVSVAPIEAPAQAVKIDQVIVREFDDKSDFPTVVDASLKGIQFDIGEMNEPTFDNFMKQAGYDGTIALNLDTKYEYDEASGEMTLEQFRFGAKDLGYLEATLKLGNYSPDAASTAGVTLHSAEIIYRDDSFAETMMASMAAKSNQDVEQFKTQLVSGISQNAQLFVPADDPTVMAVIEETKAFIEDPKGFSVSANPQQPVSVIDLMSAGSPEVWVEMLNLEIEAN